MKLFRENLEWEEQAGIWSCNSGNIHMNRWSQEEKEDSSPKEMEKKQLGKQDKEKNRN